MSFESKGSGPLVAQRSARETFERNGQIDLFNMRPFCPEGVAANCEDHWETNLTDNGNPEVILLKKRLINVVAMDILRMRDVPASLIRFSGSDANRFALYIAREQMSKNRIVCSTETHPSLCGAGVMRMLGMQASTLPVSAETGFQMRREDLLAVLQEQNIAMLSINAGTTQLGKVEIIDDEIRSLCKEKGIWLHVDAAWGGMNLGCLPDRHPQTERFRRLIALQPDSITFDFHKFIGRGNLSLLLLPGMQERDAHCLTNSLQYMENDEGFDSSKYSLSYSAAIALATMSDIGREGLSNLAINCTIAAHALAKALQGYGLQTVVTVNTPIVPVQLASDAEAARVHELLNAKGLRTSCLKNGLHGIRIVITPNMYFDDDFIDRLAQEISLAVADVRQDNAIKTSVESTRNQLVMYDMFGGMTREDLRCRSVVAPPPPYIGGRHWVQRLLKR